MSSLRGIQQGGRGGGREGTYHLVANPLDCAHVIQLVGNEGLEFGELLGVEVDHEAMHGQDLLVDV